MTTIDDLSPDLALRASLAAQRLNLTPGAVHMRLNALGLPVARSFTYAIFSGSATNPNYRAIVGLAAALEVRAAWFFDVFDETITDEEMLPSYVIRPGDDDALVRREPNPSEAD